tara:strand:- start:237 stop:1055 length:819 start_codon:yes stop_codon:yes gene_type:complete
MTTTTILSIMAVLGYLGVGIRLFDNVRLKENIQNSKHHFTTQFLLLIVLLIHFFTVLDSVASHQGLNLSLPMAFSLIFWISFFIYWVFGFFYELSILYLLIVLAGFLISPIYFLLTPPPVSLTQPINPYQLHPLFSIAAYGIFTVAGLQSLIMLLAQRFLNSGKIPRYFLSLPPLLTMEKILFKMIFIGVGLLSMALVTGMFFLQDTTGKILQFNYKIIFALLSWVIFFALCAGRVFFGWRGRVALNWTLVGCIFLILAYIGTRFVIEVLLR